MIGSKKIAATRWHRSRSIDTIIISGIANNVGCEPTAREGTVHDFRVFFLGEGIATFAIGDVSPAELQRATSATLGLLFAQVLAVDEMITKISSANRSAAPLGGPRNA